MKLDKTFDHYNPTTFREEARALEDAGYDGLLLGEAAFDPFIGLAEAACFTSRLELITAIAVALPRSPTHVAYAANDLQHLSRGRFVLGLGSQVKAHIERRFSAAWTKPVAQMREFVLALRALFDAWQRGKAARFEGDHYRITLMTPYFSPSPNPYGTPPLWLAAVGPKMCEAAGEVADGVFAHPFTTRRFLEKHTLRWIDAGINKRETPAEVAIAMPVMIATGTNDASIGAAVRAVRQQISFYGSTPAYRPVLDAHGWGELQTELNSLSKAGRWDEMPGLVEDDILNELAIVGAPEEVGPRLVARFRGLLARVSLYTPNYTADGDSLPRVIDNVRRAMATAR